MSSKAVGWTVALAASGAFAVYAAKVLRHQDWERYASPKALLAIGAAAVIYAGIVPLSALAWQVLLRDLGCRRSWRQLAGIMGISQLAKYLPGNVGQHLARGGMAVKAGVNLRAFSISLVVETLLTMIASLLVGLLGIALSRAGWQTLGGDNLRGLALIITLIGAAVAAFLLLPRFLPRVVHRIAPRHAQLAEGLRMPGRGALSRSFALYIVNFLLVGLSMIVLGEIFLPGVHHDLPLLGGAFGLAWVIGFSAPGAPAGLGVRDGLMLALLRTGYSDVDALAVVLAMRIATTASDVLCFLAAAASTALSPDFHAADS